MSKHIIFLLGLVFLHYGILIADCPGNLVQNGNFMDGRVGGAMPSPGQVSYWLLAYGTPDVGVNLGCADSGTVQMWGNRADGEGLQQVLPGSGIISGRTYRITFCGRCVNDPTKKNYVQFKFRASNVQLTSPTDGNGVTIGVTNPISSSSFTTITLPDWIATSSFTYLTISPENYSSALDGDSTSLGQVDNICVLEVGPCTPVDTLRINTGWDQTRKTTIQAGETDDEWTVISDPDVNTTEPRPAYVISKRGGWADPQPLSQWLSSYTSSVHDENGLYIFEYKFCLEDTVGASLCLSLRADDTASVYLNDQLIGSTGLFTYAPGYNVKTLCPVMQFFRGGQNHLQVYVFNTAKVAMGFDLIGTITGNFPRYWCCCSDSSCKIMGIKWNDVDGDGVKDFGESGISNWPIQLSNGMSTYTDALGNYYFLSLLPGTYTVTEGSKTGWKQTFPATGSYTVTLDKCQPITDTLNFGNIQCDSSTCLQPPSGMVAWWTGDYNAKDIAELPFRCPNNGTLWDGAGYAVGKVDGAFSFSGGWVVVSDQSELNFGTGDFTIDAWINSTDSVAEIVDKRSKLPDVGGYAFYLYHGCIALRLADNNPGFDYRSSDFSGTVVVDGTWHHVAATVHRSDPINSGVTLYVDGKVEHTWVNPIVAGNITNTDKLYIGDYFEGKIDEVEMFNRALDSTEIYSLWNAGSCGKCKHDTLESFSCDSLRINLSQIGDSCCWNLTVTNPYWGLYGIKLRGLGKTTITGITLPPGWQATQVPSADVTLTMTTGGPIPLNQSVFNNFCLDAGSTSRPRFSIAWLKSDLSVVCVDTIVLPYCGRDLQVSLGAVYPNRQTTPCDGQDMWYTIPCMNVGSMNINGAYVRFTYPKNRLSYIDWQPTSAFSTPLVSTTPGHITALLIPPSFNPFVPRSWATLNLRFHVTCKPKRWIITHADIFPKAGDIHPNDNWMQHRVQVLCPLRSSDLNDKLVSAHGCGVEGYISPVDSLTYTLHFQNTGIGPANLVVVRDTLDAALDIGTVSNIGSSHLNAFEINGRELKWTFSDIALPPESDDTLGSNGFIVFSVKQVPSNPQGTVIQNRAGIYFDSNPVVMTNTTTNTITYDPLPIAAFTVNSTRSSDTCLFDFTYTGGTAGATFLWDFGDDAIPETSSAQNPTGIRYSTSGEKNIVLQVQLGDCFSEPAIQTVIDSSSSACAVSVNNRWNMISVPLHAEDMRKTILFPTATSLAFGYDGSYAIVDTILPFKGYWLKFPSAQTITMNGYELTSGTIPVKKGWNMIGSIPVPALVSSIISDPPGIITGEFFGYNNGYTIVDTIKPFKGYWMKSKDAGTLILSTELSAETIAKNAIKIVPTDELPPPPPDGSTAVEREIPNEYGLEQAYPNPFNPATIIKYQLPADSKVSLKVYDLLGRVVSVLVDEVQSAGYRSIEWNAGLVSSGVYFYRLEATSANNPSKSFMQVKKMLLLK